MTWDALGAVGSGVGGSDEDGPARFDVRAVVSGPARLRLVVTDAVGVTLTERDLGVVERGLQMTVWDARDDAGTPLPPGTYRVALLGSGVEGTSAGSATTVELEVPAATPDTSTEQEDEVATGTPDGDAEDARSRIDARIGASLVAGVLLLMLVSVALSRMRRRR